MGDTYLNELQEKVGKLDRRIGPLSRRLAEDCGQLRQYLDGLEDDFGGWRVGLAGTVGGTPEAIRVERSLRVATNTLETLVTRPLITRVLMVDPRQFVDSAPSPTLGQLYGQWAKRQRNDLADLTLETQLHRQWSAAVPMAVEEFKQSNLGRRVVDAATDLLALRGHLLATGSSRHQSAVFESLTAHLTTGMDAASLHMIAELDLVRRMPDSQTLSPAAVADKARASAVLPRRFASLHIAHLRHAADATSQLAGRPSLRRNAGFVLDPDNFEEKSGGVRPLRALEDYRLTYGDGSVGTVGDVPSQGPRLACPALHARVEDKSGSTIMGLDAMWGFAVDAYAHAGLFDPGVRAVKHNELAAQMPGFTPQPVALSL